MLRRRTDGGPQTIPEHWGSNVDDPANKILDLL